MSARGPHSKETLREVAKAVKRRRRAETHVAIPLPPERPRVAKALEPVVRGAGQDKVVDAVSITKVFSLEDLGGKAETEEAAPLSPEARDHAARLSGVPILGTLSRAAAAELAAAIHRRTLSAGEILFHEGQPARSFFIVADGQLEVIRSRARRRGAVAQAGVNEVLGVFGLFSGRRRAATVRTLHSSIVLEVPGTALARLVQRHPSARAAVRALYQERLLTIFLASSPLFGDLQPEARVELVKLFESRDVPAGAVLVAAGHVTSGLSLVMNGQVVLYRARKGEKKGEELARLGRGQLFGVISALTGEPSAVTAVAAVPSALVVLSHARFKAAVSDHPQLAELPRKLKNEGLLITREAFVGDAGIPGLGKG